MNVILLTVDSMRWDRIGRNGYSLPVTPEIDLMMSRALSCSATYTLCPSTIGAFPSIMTSSRPLSYGGFDAPIALRPPSLSGTLSRSGFHVVHLSTVHWVSSLTGYSDGVAQEDLLAGFGNLAGLPTILLRVSFTRYNAGEISLDDLVSDADRVLPGYFDKLRRYCIFREQNAGVCARSGNSRYTAQSYSWNAVRRIVDERADRYRRDRPRFLSHAAAHFAESGRWELDKSWRLQRPWSELAEAGARRGLAALIEPFDSKSANRLRYPQKMHLDAEWLVDRVLTTARDSRSTGKPFFIWTHLFDCHIPYTSGSGRRWVKDSATWLRQIGHDASVDPTISMGPRPRTHEEWATWCALYDASLRFIDHQIGRLRKELERAGLADTLIVVSGDHGEEFGEHGDTSHKFRLYEHNAHVHTFYYHPDLKEVRVEGLSTLMDIAPTVSDCVEVKAADTWEGKSLRVLDNNPRQQIILETTYGSPCDVARRPVYLAIREGRFKLMYNERADPSDRLGWEGMRLFDIISDPGEQMNIASKLPDIAARLIKPLNARLQELRADAAVLSGSRAETA